MDGKAAVVVVDMNRMQSARHLTAARIVALLEFELVISSRGMKLGREVLVPVAQQAGE
jgi:hypothetical protein